LGGVRVTLRGQHLDGAVITIGGAVCEPLGPPEATEQRCATPPLPIGHWDVEARSDRGVSRLVGGFEAWSPAQLAGARLFDARTGLETSDAAVRYEWQRLTTRLAPDWRVRDGNTLTWLPSTNRFWMIGGWNGYQAPDGFSTIPEGSYPPENTTNEVWSSADGISWRLELTHGHLGFERRHVHSTVVFEGALWVIGGDSHQGRYNHDVLRSEDGLAWTAVLPPGAPPWSPRALQISGVYAGALWTGGGQDLLGPEEDYRYHNDLWRSEDGSHWTQVAADAPASESRWGGCGMVSSFVAWRGRMWLVGCARYRESLGHEYVHDVWSTTDGIAWTRHRTPPWSGKGWSDVLVWHDRLFVLFGVTNGDPEHGWSAGNANEVWFSDDGETWSSLAPDAPAPGSHAQGVAVHDDFLLYAGGNHTFGFGAGIDPSVWRLVRFEGREVTRWVVRGSDALGVSASTREARPLLVEDAFGPSEPGVLFDGSRSVLSLDPARSPDVQPEGRTVLWVARAPIVPPPFDWEETYAPLETIVGGPDETGYADCSIGLSNGALAMVSREPGAGAAGEPLWSQLRHGEALQTGVGEARLLGLSHAPDGRVSAWVDGREEAVDGTSSYERARGWSRLGGSLDDAYYGPHTRFQGTLGAVLVLPSAIDGPSARRIHDWARGRFGVR
jgi:hypothetical protein